MYKLTDLDIILEKMKENNKLKEFLSIVFNYKVESDNYEYYVQHIDDDVILYIYERKKSNNIYSIEFSQKESDVYMDKNYYKNTCVNVIYINKCLELYEKNIINDNLIIFCKAMNMKYKKEQKELFATILSKEIITILYE